MLYLSPFETPSLNHPGSFKWDRWKGTPVKSTPRKTNPRYSNGNLRRKHRARFKAMQARCGICGGEIHYDEPSDPQHPLSFVIDEIIPVSKWKQFGYASPAACAQDWNNLQACHYICNAAKGAKLNYKVTKIGMDPAMTDGEW